MVVKLKIMKKKYICIIISMITAMIFFGCSKNNEKAEAEQNFDINAATNIGEKYVENLVTGNYELNTKLYSKKMKKDSTDKKERANLKITSYKQEEIVEVGKAAEMKILISNTDLQKPYSSTDEIKLKIIKEDSQYKIEEIENLSQKEVFQISRSIRIRDKEDVKTNLVVDMKGMPNFAIPSSDKSKTTKLEVPKNQFNSITLTCSGEKMAVNTFNNNSFIGVLDIDEAKSTEANQSEGDSKGETGELETKPETPLGRNLKSLDILENAKVEFMGFSQEEEFLIVQYSDAQGQNLILYDLESGEVITFDFKKQYKLEKVDVTFKALDEKSIIYEVKTQKGVDINDPDARYSVGEWKLDLKNFKAEKIK